MRKQGGGQGSKRGPQSGMTKAQKGQSIVKTLRLDPEQAQKLRAAHQEMEAIARRIHGNNELSEEE